MAHHNAHTHTHTHIKNDTLREKAKNIFEGGISEFRIFGRKCEVYFIQKRRDRISRASLATFIPPLFSIKYISLFYPTIFYLGFSHNKNISCFSSQRIYLRLIIEKGLVRRKGLYISVY